METVVLLEHQDDWKDQFTVVAASIQAKLGGVFVQCHHIGSTAIAGICAKPVIDMILEVTTLSELDATAGRLGDLGYVGRGEFGMEGRRFFYKGTSPRTHHIHAYEAGHPQVIRHIWFRDYLNAFPEKAKAYESLKLKLVRDLSDDREAYTEGKSDFIQRIDREAAAHYS